MSSRLKKGLFTLAVFSVILPSLASAQYQLFGLPGVEKSALMTFTPDHPSPGDTIHFTVTSPVIDLTGATIVWYLNGKAVTTGVGMTETDIPAAKLGEQMLIEVDVSNENVSAAATATIIPTEVDLLYDSSVFTPPFYLGRALPAMGSRLQLQALARFKKSDGTFIADQDIKFTWMKGGIRIPHASGNGLDSLVIPGPIANDDADVTVEASADGGFEGSASVRIPSARPFLMLYEDNSLYGYLYNNALDVKSLSTQDEMTIAAVPFYANASNSNDPSLHYDWTVNDVSVAATSSIKNEITLGAKEGGLARVEVEVNNDIDLFFTLAGKWQILFSPGTVVGKVSPGTNLLPVTR